MGKKAALHNLGCKVNAYETEAMRQMLEKAGYEIVDFAPGADVYVINTCTVTNIADRKSRQMLHRAKKMNPDAIVVAAGCYVETAEKPVIEDPAVDIVLGNNRKTDLIAALEEFENVRKEAIYKSGSDEERSSEYEPLGITDTKEHTRAYIKVQDGCNQFCSYCIIPYARGRVRSRRMDDIRKEVHLLASNGCREIVLTGIQLSSYGTDLGTSLPDLIRAVHEEPGIERIRLGSLEPNIITETFAGEISRLPKVCPHFHLSLQSGCDPVLRRMNRRYTTDEYAQKCGILRKYFDRPAITTDVIVGFPGESEEEFADTLRFLTKIRLYETHIFKFSARKGTRAAAMSGQIPEQVKSERSNALIALGEENRSAFERDHLGEQAEVLLEEPQVIDGRNYYTGYTRKYMRAAVLTEDDLTNRMKNGKLSQILSPHIFLLEND